VFSNVALVNPEHLLPSNGSDFDYCDFQEWPLEISTLLWNQSFSGIAAVEYFALFVKGSSIKCFPEDLANIARKRGFHMIFVGSNYPAPGFRALVDWRTAIIMKFPVFEVPSSIKNINALCVAEVGASENPYFNLTTRTFLSIIVILFSMIRAYFAVKCAYESKYQKWIKRIVLLFSISNLFVSVILIIQQALWNYQDLSDTFINGLDLIYTNAFLYDMGDYLSYVFLYALSNRITYKFGKKNQMKNIAENFIILSFITINLVRLIVLSSSSLRIEVHDQLVIVSISLFLNAAANILTVYNKYDLTAISEKKYIPEDMLDILKKFSLASFISLLKICFQLSLLFSSGEYQYNPTWVVVQGYIVFILGICSGSILVYYLSNFGRYQIQTKSGLLHGSESASKKKNSNSEIELVKESLSSSQSNGGRRDFINVWS
jgi:hypothetical protein